MGTTALSEARDHATAHVPTARPGDLVEDLRVGLVGAHFECADDVAVVADGVLVGMLPIERVFGRRPAPDRACPPHRMLRVLLTEHDENIARIGGYLASTQRARQAAEEPVSRRLWHRLPWLLVGLAGAFAAAVIVGRFDKQLEQEVLLAFFLPGVVYM